VLDCGYIVEQNGIFVHYFVSNIYSLKVITYSIYTLCDRQLPSDNEVNNVIDSFRYISKLPPYSEGSWNLNSRY
jgi:hypothetical protein